MVMMAGGEEEEGGDEEEGAIMRGSRGVPLALTLMEETGTSSGERDVQGGM